MLHGSPPADEPGVKPTGEPGAEPTDEPGAEPTDDSEHAQGQARGPVARPRTGLRWVPLALGLLAAAGLGIWLGPLQPLLETAAAIAAEGIR
jgi:hypothetical protein